MKKTIEVPITQFVRPNGRRRAVTCEVDGELEPKVKAILAKGYRFTAEELSGMGVSLCIEDNDSDVAVEIAENGPGPRSPQVMLEKLIREFKGVQVRETKEVGNGG